MKIHVTLYLSGQSRTFEFQGRLGWAKAELAGAGAKGVPPSEHPAPRLSAYMHSLRKRGSPIETESETHGGPYPGQHARYRLTCDAMVRLVA